MTRLGESQEPGVGQKSQENLLEGKKEPLMQPGSSKIVRNNVRKTRGAEKQSEEDRNIKEGRKAPKEGEKPGKSQEPGTGRKSQEQLTNPGSKIVRNIVRKTRELPSDEDRKEHLDREGKKVPKEAEKPGTKARNRKLGVSGFDEPKLNITDLIKNFRSLERAASSEMNRSQGEGLNLARQGKVVMKIEEQTDRKKRKLGEDINLLESPSQKRCRNPKSETESERDKLSITTFKSNTLLTRQEPAGAARSGEQGSHDQGVGEVLGEKIEGSPEAPARPEYVRPYGQCTASLLGEQNL